MSDTETEYLQPEQGDDPSDTGVDVAYAMSPATATIGALKFGESSKFANQVWEHATKKLGEGGFDCKQEDLRDLLELLQKRAEDFGWDNSVLAIPDDPNNPIGATKDFVANHGTFKLDYLKQVATTYNGDSSRRVGQDSSLLYSCLFATLSKIGRTKVTAHRNMYLANGKPAGVLFLKVLIQMSTVDTNASVTLIRNQLANIETFLAKVSYDVTKTNQRVAELLQDLHSRGETTHDLMNNLFNAYKSVKDREFSRYITQKESDYEEGVIHMSEERLMLLAENKYKTLVEKGQWQAPTEEEEKIVALQTEIRALKNGRGADKKAKNKPTKKEGNSKGGGDKSKKKDEAWMHVAPKEGEPKAKSYNGKQWHWCANHQKWCLHSTEQCKGVGTTAKGANKGKKPDGNQGNNPRLVKAQKATVRFTDDDSDSD
jgi:hypothetical protein